MINSQFISSPTNDCQIEFQIPFENQRRILLSNSRKIHSFLTESCHYASLARNSLFNLNKGVACQFDEYLDSITYCTQTGLHGLTLLLFLSPLTTPIYCSCSFFICQLEDNPFVYLVPVFIVTAVYLIWNENCAVTFSVEEVQCLRPKLSSETLFE